jgi:uncharacterized protein (TIGR03083 family)
VPDQLDSLRRSADQAVDLVARVSDPSTPVPGSDWVSGEVVAHLIAVANNLAGMSRNAGRPYASVDSIAQQNEEMIAEVDARDPDTLRAALDELVAELSKPPSDRTFRWHAGIDVTVLDAAGITTGELLIHGYDLAKALRAPWPITRADATQVLHSLISVIPDFVDEEAAAGVRAVYDVRLRGDDQRYRIAFDDGSCTVERVEKVADADCRISADPVAFMLVSYGRRSQWWAAATGKVAAFGTKPWLGFKFASLIRSP